MKFYTFIFLFSSAISASTQSINEIDDYAQTISYSSDYVEVAKTLAAPYDNEEHQVRAIFSWIIFNFSYDQNLKDKVASIGKTRINGDSKEDVERKKQDRIDNMVDKMLSRKKGICQDYSHLFNKMCGALNIESKFITGFGRFGPENIGRRHRTGNHAWNVVKLNGSWHLLDVTWTDGMDFGDQDFGEGFWMVDPEVFILSHYPDDDTWQLLDKKLTASEFADLPYMHGGYLKYNIDYINPDTGFINSGSKPMIFKIKGDLDGLPLMVIKNSTPSPAKAQKVGDYYEIEADLKGARGIFHLGVLNKDRSRVEPLISMKVR